MNPMEGVEIVGPTIDPLWEIGQNFSMVCFLSHTARFSPL
jgi:hypothetical protein